MYQRRNIASLFIIIIIVALIFSSVFILVEASLSSAKMQNNETQIVNNNVSSSYSNSKEGYLQALKYYDRALAIDPSATDILTNKGMVLVKMGNYQEAVGIFDKILSIDSNNAGALYNKGVVLDIEGKDIQAKEYKDKALEIDPNYTVEFINRESILTSIAESEPEPSLSKPRDIDSKEQSILNSTVVSDNNSNFVDINKSAASNNDNVMNSTSIEK
jgi:tetratricopeptide (TPR) repeat protein